MITFVILAFLNFLVLLTMLGFEFKRLGCHLSTFGDKKVLIFMILAIEQFCKYSQAQLMIYICTVVFFHYSFANQVTRIFLQTFEEGCRTLVFFLTMNFYIKMCSKLLKRREVWLKAFRVLWNISLTLFVAVETYVVIAVTQKRVNDNNLCNNSTYLTM